MTVDDVRAQLCGLPLDAEDLAVVEVLSDVVEAMTATLASTDLGRDR